MSPIKKPSFILTEILSYISLLEKITKKNLMLLEVKIIQQQSKFSSVPNFFCGFLFCFNEKLMKYANINCPLKYKVLFKIKRFKDLYTKQKINHLVRFQLVFLHTPVFNFVLAILYVILK